MEPRDKDGRRKLKECEIAFRKQRFEEAITTPEVAMVSFKNPNLFPLNSTTAWISRDLCF